MKIRQKIAMLLATAMVVTAVPAMTMAKSDFSLTNGIITKEKDEHIRMANGEMNLKIELKDSVTTQTVFFVTLANAEWNEKDGGTVNYNKKLIYTEADVAKTSPVGYVNRNSSKELEVRLFSPGTTVGSIAPITGYVIPTGATVPVTTNKILIPVDAQLKGGDATISVDGNGTVVSDMAPVVFAKTSENKATVTFGDAKNLYKYGTVADITIEEPIKATMGTTQDIVLELDNTDYEFVINSITTGNLTFNYELSKGFSTGTTVGAASYVRSTDTSSIKFTLTMPSNPTAPGRIKIKDLPIKLKATKAFVEDDTIELTVKSGDGFDKVTETTGKVAVAKKLSCGIEMKDKKTVDIVAGKNEKIEFTVFENVNDSMLDRMVEVRIDNAFFADGKVDDNRVTDQTMKVKTKFATDTTYSAASAGGYTGLSDFAWVKNKDKEVIGFDFSIPAGGVRQADIDKITFEDVKVFVPVDKTGDVKITVNGRAVGDEISTVAVNAIAPLEITKDELTVKVGLKEQKGGKIVLKETDKARFQTNEILEITFDKQDDGFQFTEKPVVKVVEGDLKLDLDNMKVRSASATQSNAILIPISRKSSSASTIEITDVTVKVDRTVPQGKYDLKLNGAAIEPGCIMGSLTVKDFLNVATANTEDLTTNNGLRKGVASFVIGSDKFIVNGVEQTMDAKAYLDPAGRTMVPLRFVANALGIDDNSIFYAQKTATIVAGAKTISLTLGDKVAKMNGVAAKVMDVAPTMVNDRVYVPVGEIATLLSVTPTWDDATQTATFTVE